MDTDRTIKDRVYEAPELRFVGSLEDFTRGSADGSHLDSGFATSTPTSSLTFS